MSVSQLANGLNHNQLMSLIQVCESTRRYNDMCQLTKIMAESKISKGETLNEYERQYVFAGYRHVTAEKRASWRTLCYMSDSDEVNEFKNTIENELEILCTEALQIFIKFQNMEDTEEQQIFWLKACGDYYRYLAEFKSDEKYKQLSFEYYKKGMDLAEAKLHCTNPIRLGLALNFSVCYYEILNEKQNAFNVAKKSFDSAIQKLHDIDDSCYKDIVVIMQLLRDNLTLWTGNDDSQQ